jgi:hypothetical protein
MGAPFLTISLQTAIPQNLRDAANSVLMKAQQAMPWIGGLQGQAAMLMNQGSWPYPTIASDVTSDPVQQAQWNQFRNAYAPITGAIATGQYQAAAGTAAALAANLAFWDSIAAAAHAATFQFGAAASDMQDAWDNLRFALNRYQAASKGVQTSLSILQQTAADPILGPKIPQAAQYAATIASQQNGIISSMLRTLGPLASDPAVKAEAGLGIIPAAVAIAGAVAVGSISAAVIVVVSQMAALKEQANTYAQEVLKARGAINDQLLKDGKITPAQWQANNDKNSAAAAASEKAGGGLSFNMGTAGWIAVGVGVAALLGLALWRGKSSPAA